MFTLTDDEAKVLSDILGRMSKNDIKKIYHAHELTQADPNNETYLLIKATKGVESELAAYRAAELHLLSLYARLNDYVDALK